MKYLYSILPMALLALASCVNEGYDDDIKNENYTKAFIMEFGIIDPNHSWGFDNQVKSRAVSTNGNEWKEPPVVTAQEWIDVQTYLRTQKENLNDVREELYTYTSFFVTEVGASFEEYTAVNGTTIEGSDKMNHLMIAEWVGWTMDELNNADSGSSGSVTQVGHWEHCSNFNFASNNNFGGNTVMFTGDSESDIGAYQFACHNSHDSHYHNRYKVIKGSDVDPKYGFAYYVCFDFDSHTDNFATTFQFKYNELTENTQSITGYADFTGTYTNEDTGSWPTEAELIDKLGLTTDYANGLITVTSISINSNDGGNTRFAVTYDKVTIQKNQRSVNLTFDDEYYDKDDPSTWPNEATMFAKAGLTTEYAAGTVEYVSTDFSTYSDGDKYIPGNDIYDDWVIRIVGPAIRASSAEEPDYPWDESDPVPESSYKRIMAEDLSVRANNNLNVNKSDWDFNDVVLDVYYDTESSTMHIKLQALGGTLPVYIYDKNLAHHTAELHTYFDVSTRTMVNTGAGPSKAAVKLNDEVSEFVFDGDYCNIRIFVDVDGYTSELKDLDGLGGLVELQARKGNAPSKFLVPATVDWSKEYNHISTTYPGFSAWVADENQTFWGNLTNQ